MNKVFLSIGSNLGDKQRNLDNAIEIISQKVGDVLKQSSVYATAPWGEEKQPVFYNQVLLVETKFCALETLYMILQIEKDLGRIRVKKMGARVIDIDILFFNDEIINTLELQVPHPYLHQRNFVLIPLNEIAPETKHPVFQISIATLLKDSADALLVEKLEKEN